MSENQDLPRVAPQGWLDFDPRRESPFIERTAGMLASSEGWKRRFLMLLNRALEVAEGIEDAKCRSWALCAIAEELGKVDIDRARELWERALEVAEGIEDAKCRSWALCAIAKELAKVDEEKAVCQAERIEDAYHKALAFVSIARTIREKHCEDKEQNLLE